MTTATQPYGAPVKTRPLGVTILAILNALGGILTILGGVAAIGLTAATGIFAALGAIVGVVMILVGLFQLFIAWGLWTGRGWAWFLALIFGILGALFALLSLVGGDVSSIVSLLINGVIVYYLFTPPVKAFFGK